MTDRKLNNLARAGAFAFVVILALLAFIGAAFGQDVSTTYSQKCDHINNSFERFDAIRLTPMSTVLNLEPVEGGHKLETRTDAKYVTKYTAFTLTKDTAFDAKEIKRGKLVFVLYSAVSYTHLTLPTTERV